MRAHAAHPGYSATNLQSNTTKQYEKVVMALSNRFIAQSEEIGALSLLYAATQDLAGASYTGPNRFREFRGYPGAASRTAEARDIDVAKRLWTVSEEMTGVTFPPNIPVA